MRQLVHAQRSELRAKDARITAPEQELAAVKELVVKLSVKAE